MTEMTGVKPAVLIERFGIGKPEKKAARKQISGIADLAEAMVHCTSGSEARKLIDRGSRPE